jgi:hypothetical protein
MRKNTESIAIAFKNGQPKRDGNKTTDGQTFYLHGNAIARRDRGRLEVCWAGWVTATTAECVNGVLSAYGSAFRVGRKDGWPEARANGVSSRMDDNTWQAVSDVSI